MLTAVKSKKTRYKRPDKIMLPPTMVVTLIHIQGSLKGEIQEFCESVITIGRLPSLTLHFPSEEPGVSRTHARIERDGNQFKLTDLSKFGTFVNGKQIKETYLRNGDVLEFGPGGPKASFQAEIVEGYAAAEVIHPPVSAPPPEPLPPQQPFQAAPEPVKVPPIARQPQPQPMAPPPPRPVMHPEKANVPLVIQFGPAIRSFSELPVVLGSDANADFVLQYPGISGRHLQIFHTRGAYWIKDLAGVGIVMVNREKIDTQVQLKPFDEIECCPGGPTFRFIGEGRLVEVERELAAPWMASTPRPEAPVGAPVPPKEEDSFFAKILKGFKK